jgi:hypothetical protein
LSCNTKGNKLDKSELEDFVNIQIQFVTGDETMTLHKMSFFKVGQKIMAKKERPFYYYGSKTDSIWTIDIGASELQLINEFISRAETQKDTCSFNSSSIDRYDINIAGLKQINIIGNCHWNGIDYDSIERNIFSQKFLELENKRLVVADSISNSFIGCWNVVGLENGFIPRTKITLKRINDSDSQAIEQKVWNFDSSFKSQIKKDLDIDEGSSLIDIRGSTYEIIEIQSDRINLIYLWT